MVNFLLKLTHFIPQVTSTCAYGYTCISSALSVRCLQLTIAASQENPLCEDSFPSSYGEHG